MTSFYSYYRNLTLSPITGTTGLSGGYSISNILDTPTTDENDMPEDRIIESVAGLTALRHIAALMPQLEKMIGKSPEQIQMQNQMLNDGQTVWKEIVSKQVSTGNDDERFRMLDDWQKYNKNEDIRNDSRIMALALAMLYIADGYRMASGRVNSRAYRRFITALRKIDPKTPLRLCYTAAAKIMHNPFNGSDAVVESVEKRQHDNLEAELWSEINPRYLKRKRLPKTKPVEGKSLADIAWQPGEVKQEII